MSFQNPAGLWLLLGIPVLVLFWLIRPKHENRRVSSSYIWRLSDRFMKSRMPFTLIERWLVFALQLLFVAGGAFLTARPVFAQEARADYFVILDASASMHTLTESGLTRYDAALNMILDLAKETDRGHTVTVVTAGEEARTVVSESSSRKEISEALTAYPCGWGRSSLSGAMTLAQLFCYEHPEAQVIVYTDQAVEKAENLTVVSLDEGEWNASLTDLSVTRESDGGCTLEADLTSWGQDAVIAVGLSLDGRLTDAENFCCEADTPVKVRFSLPASDADGILCASIAIKPGDAFEADNELMVFPDNERPCETLLVSETPFYLETALNALDRGQIRVSASAVAVRGDYDLMIFDNTESAANGNLSAGAYLFINPGKMPEGIEAKTVSEETGRLVASAADSVMKERLLRLMKLSGVSVARHTVARASDDWITVCSVGSDPILLAETSEDGITSVVLLFDLHDSNFPLTTDFLYLIRNLMNIAVPSLLEKRLTEVGDTQRVTLSPTTSFVRVTAPDGSVLEFESDLQEGTEGTMKITLPGIYTVEAGEEGTGFFAAVPQEESRPQSVSAFSLIAGEAAEDARETAKEGMWRIAAVVLLLLLLAEWGIWLYEQC
ncbi:MAG: BatA and WFA domain-containing protein [Oscillospiraceae bacterium]|nr:BatA and WFA domain-containing protein [Oscillospiraceae bacterium]